MSNPTPQELAALLDLLALHDRAAEAVDALLLATLPPGKAADRASDCLWLIKEAERPISEYLQAVPMGWEAEVLRDTIPILVKMRADVSQLL